MTIHEAEHITHFGEWLRSARKRKGMTQMALAQRLNVNAGRISEWEQQQQLPAAGEVTRIVEVLGGEDAAVSGSNASSPRVRPWEHRMECRSTLQEVQETEDLRQRLLERTSGRPWSPSWQLLAEDEDR